jgi:hypothetical protein
MQTTPLAAKLITLFATISFLFPFCAALTAQNVDVPGPIVGAGTVVTGRPPNTASGWIKFSEVSAHRSYIQCSDHLDVIGGFEGPDTCYRFWRDSGRFLITGALSLDDFAVSDFDENTAIRFLVGGSEFSARLGDDTNYVRGATSARFQLVRYVGNINDPKLRPYLTVKLTWNTRRLQLRATGKTIVYFVGNEIDGASPIQANEFLGQPSGIVQPVVPAFLEFGEATAMFDIPGSARIRTGTGSPAQSVIHLSGKGEAAAGE